MYGFFAAPTPSLHAPAPNSNNQGNLPQASMGPTELLMQQPLPSEEGTTLSYVCHMRSTAVGASQNERLKLRGTLNSNLEILNSNLHPQS